MNSPQEIEREIAIYGVLMQSGEIMGDNFVGARRKMLAGMCRPADIHKVELKARELRDKGNIFMRGHMLVLDTDKVRRRVDQLMQSIDGGHPTSIDMSSALKANIRALSEKLTDTPSVKLASV